MVSSSASTDREVPIRTTTDQRQLPAWLRARLRLGARRLERLRRDIAVQARLPTVPPIEIVPEVWRVDGDLVLGCARVVERAGKAHLGALLSAPLVVQSDDDLLRTVLVIQFYECIRRMIAARVRPLGDKAPEEVAVASLADPTAWFGPEDAARVVSWNGRSNAGLEVVAGLLAKTLPTVDPPPTDKAQAVRVPDWVLARIKRGNDHLCSFAKEGQPG